MSAFYFNKRFNWIALSLVFVQFCWIILPVVGLSWYVSTGYFTFPNTRYVERLKGMSLLVRAELDGTPLLESKIQTDTAYQKQQGTLIVWSERDNFDLALSFQEKAGCDEIWEKICQVSTLMYIDGHESISFYLCLAVWLCITQH